MKATAMEITGQTACFRKPDVNANVYFTYSHIHKVALLGLFGAVLGLGGYNSQYQDISKNGYRSQNIYPEFYEKLRFLQVSIVPHGDRGYFPKKIQTFNNSVGYASQEEGNNLVVKEQWLENPHWTVYVLDDGSDIYCELQDALLDRRCVYHPYLGKNDHPAALLDVRKVQLQPIDEVDRIDSLFALYGIDFQTRSYGQPYFYREVLPVGLDDKINGYIFSDIAYTNRKIEKVDNRESLYRGEEKNLFFL